jgi:linolenate 9R-lipoxygenase
MSPETQSLKEQFTYFGTAGKDYPRFDPAKPLPQHLQPTKHYAAQLGMQALPFIPLFPPFNVLFTGIVEKLGIRSMAGKQLRQWMPANLTRMHPDKFSDEFFVERRLNGFNPGKLNRVEGKDWQYEVRYKTGRHQAKPAGILPNYVEARFVLAEQALTVHSIAYSFQDGGELTCQPGHEDWEKAKQLFRNAEYIFQEIQSHLARTHMNMDQYAMAFYRNVVKNPIRQLLEPHFVGLLNIDKKGAALIIGNKGFIPEASSLTPEGVDEVLIEEISRLSYKGWSPKNQALPDFIHNNYFDPVALCVWQILEEYVDAFVQNNELEIQRFWPEIEGMSGDLVAHSVLDPKLVKQFGTLAVENLEDLKGLCVYVIYHSLFFHSWVNNKQYEDGGDIEYAAIGLWDSNSPDYKQVEVDKRHDAQIKLMWQLANVHYKPVMEVGPPALKKLLWDHKATIETGIPLGWLMMSINI